MIKTATSIGDANVLKNTYLALQLHRYQYNGPDPEGFYTDIPDDKSAAYAICLLLHDLVSDAEEYKICKAVGR